MMEHESISFFGTEREYEQNYREMENLFVKTLASGRTIGGEHVEQIEKLVSDLCSYHLSYVEKDMHAVAVGSGTDALFFALKCAGVGPGDYVLTTAFSFMATATTIKRVGATPIFIDIDPDTFLLDLNKCIHLRVAKAMVFVDLFGVCPDFSVVENFCHTHDLVLIEDAAQSFGGYSGNRPAGNMGDYACISFDPTKVIGAPGGGGMVLCRWKERAEEIRKMRYKGQAGCNSQMSEFDAAIVEYKLSRLPEYTAKRWKIAQYYNANIKISGFLTKPSHKPSVYQKYVMDFAADDARGQMLDYLESKNIQTKIHYPYILPEKREYNQYACAWEASQFLFSIPIHPYLSDNEVEYIVKTINENDIV